MGFFNKYPYTDEHELNLDWIIAKINALKDRVKGVEDAIKDIVVDTPNDGKLTIKRNNTIVGDFTANQATDEDINIVVPENTSDLNNDSGFVVSSDLATVATTGDYDNLINTPTIPAAQVNSDWNAISGVAQILNKPSLATVATSGSYSDLSNKPTIPAAQVNSDWNANSGVAEILNKPTIPTKTSELINDSGFISNNTVIASLGAYETNDTHYMLLCTLEVSSTYTTWINLLVNSTFWGNQHHSTHLLAIHAGRTTSTLNYNGNKSVIDDQGSRRFYIYKNSNSQLSIYVYVNGGNGYGTWTISDLSKYGIEVTPLYSTNVALPSGSVEF